MTVKFEAFIGFQDKYKGVNNLQEEINFGWIKHTAIIFVTVLLRNIETLKQHLKLFPFSTVQSITNHRFPTLST